MRYDQIQRNKKRARKLKSTKYKKRVNKTNEVKNEDCKSLAEKMNEALLALQ